ncbi:MAG: 30S ribosomal protein S21 [Ignavibacteriae bacterium]|nr:30S ribosomal protein S21 [Ignavibacteriota bacterium]
MVGITIQENENVDRAIRRFKKKYERSGVLKEVKRRSYFTKPSVEKRLKKIKAVRRAYRQRMEEQM